MSAVVYRRAAEVEIDVQHPIPVKKGPTYLQFMLTKKKTTKNLPESRDSACSYGMKEEDTLENAKDPIIPLFGRRGEP